MQIEDVPNVQARDHNKDSLYKETACAIEWSYIIKDTKRGADLEGKFIAAEGIKDRQWWWVR